MLSRLPLKAAHCIQFVLHSHSGEGPDIVSVARSKVLARGKPDPEIDDEEVWIFGSRYRIHSDFHSVSAAVELADQRVSVTATFVDQDWGPPPRPDVIPMSGLGDSLSELDTEWDSVANATFHYELSEWRSLMQMDGLPFESTSLPFNVWDGFSLAERRNGRRVAGIRVNLNRSGDRVIHQVEVSGHGKPTTANVRSMFNRAQRYSLEFVRTEAGSNED